MSLETKIHEVDLEKMIPPGPYCYFGSRNPADKSYKACPFWDLRGEDNRYGYCSHLDRGDDSEDATLCLFDQVKECGINTEYDYEPEVMTAEEYDAKYGDDSE